jgi:hypothetical protein
MKTVYLKEQTPPLDQLLAMAGEEDVLLVAEDGAKYTLEATRDFDLEAAELGNSEKFMRFLEERSQYSAKTPIEDFCRKLDVEDT